MLRYDTLNIQNNEIFKKREVNMKNFMIGLLLFIMIVLVNAVSILLDKNTELNTELQSQIEKASDLEMIVDDMNEDKLIKDYLRSR